jgi:hypothetical protein
MLVVLFACCAAGAGIYVCIARPILRALGLSPA